jgi:hypothetical protein
MRASAGRHAAFTSRERQIFLQLSLTVMRGARLRRPMPRYGIVAIHANREELHVGYGIDPRPRPTGRHLKPPQVRSSVTESGSAGREAALSPAARALADHLRIDIAC